MLTTVISTKSLNLKFRLKINEFLGLKYQKE